MHGIKERVVAVARRRTCANWLLITARNGVHAQGQMAAGKQRKGPMHGG